MAAKNTYEAKKQIPKARSKSLTGVGTTQNAFFNEHPHISQILL
jgi:hypothetical protein